jgi:glycosyltransferase involved in cell wall biosynthesis
MGNRPFFSIIIPTLNEEKFIPHLLKDIVHQTFLDYEVIVVDSYSEDQTKKVVQQFSISSLRFYEIKDRNVSSQRNFGADKAQGQYLVFLDADARINRFFLKNLYRLIYKRKGLIFIPSLATNMRDPQYKAIFSFLNLIIEVSQKLNKPVSSGGSMICEKNFFHLIGGFEKDLFLCEDHHLVQKARLWGVRAVFMNKIKVVFNLRRMQKEGELKTFYQIIKSTAYMLLKGEVKEKIFDYPMGGLRYTKTDEKKSLEKEFNFYIQKINRFFKR